MPQRYQREIEEILGKVNEGTPEGSERSPRGSRGPRRAAPQRRPRRLRFSFTPGGLFRAGLGLLLGAFVLNLLNVSILGFGVAAPLAYLGVGVWVYAYVSYFTRPRRASERRWRGQPIDDAPSEGPLSRIWRWLTRG